ncbi:1-acyl-sn-glycerol-3-phosphate acyltransferase [Tundrisphaera sp. TA3]|uniref:1-acyl-sn-glycerol-3-phosphate acyltransferase n=1 Tax=Tundrisphaera sp. TA3 TaxID=3435775 RepID=UPI003EBB6255
MFPPPPLFAAIGAWTWAAIAAGTMLVAAAIFVAILPTVVQPFLRIVLALRYRIRVIGLENVPRTGPVLLAANHITWFDGFFLAAVLPRKGTALMYAGIFKLPVIGSLSRRCGLIPVAASGPRAQRAAIDAGRKVLKDGGLLGIFPEAQISRSGLTGPFKRGLELIVSGNAETVVVPVYLGNLWGSLLSNSGGRFLRKWPQGLRRSVVVVFGPPVPPPVTAFVVRQAVLEAGVRAAEIAPMAPPETVDPTLPHYTHPTLGALTGSAQDIAQPSVGVFQPGHREGSAGLTLPGVVIRAVDDAGSPLPPDAEGRLQALVPGRGGWADLGQRGHLDGDGFVFLGSTRDESAG